MNTNKNLLKTYEELTVWRKKSQAMKKVEDEPSKLLKKTHNLASLISVGLKDVSTAGRQICNETNDIRYQFEPDNSLHIGRESVRPLIELKNIVTEVFASVEGIGTDNNFTEDIAFGSTFHELEEIVKFAKKSNEFLKKLNFITEVISHLEDDREKIVRSESTLSITGSDPSTSGFSLFENIKTKGATSSPISSVKGT